MEIITPIDTNNPDYYQWGKNCKLCGWTREETIERVCKVWMANESQDELFWQGFDSVVIDIKGEYVQ